MFFKTLQLCASSERPFGFKLFKDGNEEPFETPGKVVEMVEVFRGHENYVLNAVFDKDVFLGKNDLEAVLEVRYFAIGEMGVSFQIDFSLTFY